jgi:hypothetical protein
VPHFIPWFSDVMLYENHGREGSPLRSQAPDAERSSVTGEEPGLEQAARAKGKARRPLSAQAAKGPSFDLSVPVFLLSRVTYLLSSSGACFKVSHRSVFDTSFPGFPATRFSRDAPADSGTLPCSVEDDHGC